MPFKSESQRRKFYADPKLRKYAAEFEAATPAGSLPDRVRAPRPKPGKAKRRHAQRSALTAMLAAGGNHKPHRGGNAE